MIYTNMGRTGLKVSRLCLGTMNFGDQTDEKESFAIMDRALELGINYFDTANNYGRPFSQGKTEELIGRWLSQGGGRREQIVLATKIFTRVGPGVNDRGLSAYSIRRECANSLRRLQTDHIDLYQMHHIDRGGRNVAGVNPKGVEEHSYWEGPGFGYSVPWDEIWQGMERLIFNGDITYVGSCNFAAWHIAHSNGIANQRDLFGLVSEQSIYNLNNRTVELEVIPACAGLGLGFIPWSPLDRGLLAGVLEKELSGRRSSVNVEMYRDRLMRYEALCKDIGEAPATVGLAWTLSNPVVTATIIGPRTMEQLEQSMRALEVELASDVLEELDAIWPGPGGISPEAYAW